MKVRDTRTIRLTIRVTSRDFRVRDEQLKSAEATAMRLARTALADAGFSIWSTNIDTVSEGTVDTDDKPEVARHA